MTSTTVQTEIADTVASDPAALAAVIHDDVLQSLGVAVLGVDLCRRFHQRMRFEQALDELGGIVEALGLALVASERLLPYLNRHLTGNRPTTARPGLMVVGDAPGEMLASRPTAGPQEIVETLVACEIQARRCRGQYDAGLGEETMRDLELMLQRLEFVSVTFRDVMGALRQLASRPLAPLAGASGPAALAWSRSA